MLVLSTGSSRDAIYIYIMVTMMLPILELELELEVGGWRAGLLGTAIATAEQPLVIKGEGWQRTAGLLYEVRVALKLYPEIKPPEGGD